jgi:hypothetical protein
LLKRFFLIAIAVAVVVVLFTLLQRPAAPEPEYQGRTISELLNAHAIRPDARLSEAIKVIGTNALPYIVQHVEQQDSRFRKYYNRLRNLLPAGARKIFPEPARVIPYAYAATTFSYLGTNATPHAVALLKHQNPNVRRFAAAGLQSFKRQIPHSSEMLTPIIETLIENETPVRFHAVSILMEIGSDASNAVPYLTNIVATPSTPANSLHLRMAAIQCLGRMGPASADALPILNQLLVDSELHLRVNAAIAIWKIQQDTNTVLSALLKDLHYAKKQQMWEVFHTLGEIGPAATDALPRLKYELLQPEHNWLHQYITTAINRIESPTNQNAPTPSAE